MERRVISDLVDRLRGIYTVPVNDGGGLLDGKDTFTQVFPVTPIQREAADEIEHLRAVNIEWDAIVERSGMMLDKCCECGKFIIRYPDPRPAPCAACEEKSPTP